MANTEHIERILRSELERRKRLYEAAAANCRQLGRTVVKRVWQEPLSFHLSYAHLRLHRGGDRAVNHLGTPETLG